MSDTPTTPELEQRLKKIEADIAEGIDVPWKDVPFLLSALREALATVEQLGEEVYLLREGDSS